MVKSEHPSLTATYSGSSHHLLPQPPTIATTLQLCLDCDCAHQHDHICEHWRSQFMHTRRIVQTRLYYLKGCVFGIAPTAHADSLLLQNAYTRPCAYGQTSAAKHCQPMRNRISVLMLRLLLKRHCPRRIAGLPSHCRHPFGLPMPIGFHDGHFLFTHHESIATVARRHDIAYSSSSSTSSPPLCD